MAPSASKEETASPKFHKFPELPNELKAHVWDFAVLGASSVPQLTSFSLHDKPSGPPRFGDDIVSGRAVDISPVVSLRTQLLSDLREASYTSRKAVEKAPAEIHIWKHDRPGCWPAVPVMFNPSIDAIFLAGYLELLQFKYHDKLHPQPDAPSTERLAGIKILALGGILENAYIERKHIGNSPPCARQAICKYGYEATYKLAMHLMAFKGLETLIIISPETVRLSDDLPEPGPSTGSYLHKVLDCDAPETSRRRLNLWVQLFIRDIKDSVDQFIDWEKNDTEFGQKATPAPYSKWWADPRIVFMTEAELRARFG
ncbi:hypothetical protein DL95DRAFT_486340 [Leptodontidium sp. 2 PMI_412]|nr:hypothetical protein DL95DRAFT_486340 [Leptodontidium sp. 2 PMI_412]